MKTKILKKIQRRVNSVIRNLNEVIKEDDALRGRFSAKQIDRKTFFCHDYENGSELSVLFFVQLKDNKTGFTKTVTIEVFSFMFYYKEFVEGNLHVEMDRFMLQDCHFTEE